MSASARTRLGALLFDVPRLLWCLRPGPRGARAPWVRMRNRTEILSVPADGRGARCDWRWTSDLHVAQVYPALGLRLFRRVLREFPISLAKEPLVKGEPRVAFLIGHRGLERLPLLLAVLRTVAAQHDVAVECIVVEQSRESELRGRLPEWVQLIHTPPPRPDMPYARAWTLNVAARAARAALLVLHDGDMLVPQTYARDLVRLHDGGAEVMDLKRFRFELRAEQNAAALAGRFDEIEGPLDHIVQNLQGGTSAIDRRTFLELGGFDESFVGWGGEDNEFWERAALRRVHAFGWLPFVHLWHPAQPGKGERETTALKRYQELTRMPAEERIALLRARPFGQPEGPSVPETLPKVLDSSP
jgi:N-terminal domain of galactosyltransferase